MNEHVVDYQQSGHPDGMIAVLQPHRHGEPRDWTDDGVTCEPGVPCSAISASSNVRCGKREAVVFLDARAKYTPLGSGGHDLFLCGGHFNTHRAGNAIRVIVTTGKLR